MSGRVPDTVAEYHRLRAALGCRCPAYADPDGVVLADGTRHFADHAEALAAGAPFVVSSAVYDRLVSAGVDASRLIRVSTVPV